MTPMPIPPRPRPDVVEFLRARYDEDEAALTVPDWYCTDSARGEGWGSRGDECPLCDRYMFDGTESVTKDAWHEHLDTVHARDRRALAAKRRVLAAATRTGEVGCDAAITEGKACDVTDTFLAAMASEFADHPDYDPRWAQ